MAFGNSSDGGRLAGLGVALLVMASLAACSTPRTKAPEISNAASAAEAAKQREFAAEQKIENWRRLWRVSAPLVTHGSELCGDALAPYLGLHAFARQDFAGDLAGTMAKVLGVTDRPEVVAVDADSPAEAAGFQTGDLLLAVGTKEIATGRDRDYLVGLMEDEVEAGQEVTFKVGREGGSEYLTVMPSTRCDYAVHLEESEKIRAYADGDRVVVTEGMLRFATKDQHLAFVIGHELAHNAMEHRDAKVGNSVVAGAGGLLLDIGLAVLGVNTQGAFMKAAANAGGGAFSVEFEQEADYVGLYFLARGGYELDGAADIWRLMAARSPGSIDHSVTHPTAPDRFLALESHIEEVKSKMEAGEPLLPDLEPEAESDGQFDQDAYPD